MLLTSAIVSGIGLGSMYGLIALGFYLTYAVSGTVNFAQGSSMMLGAVLTFTFARTFGWPYPPAVVLALCSARSMGWWWSSSRCGRSSGAAPTPG